MSNFWKNTTKITLLTSAIALLTLSLPQPAWSQLLPQIWGTIGSKDDDLSYGAGVRLLNFGIEVGTGEEGATGGDILTFIPFPVVSPYVGLGFYSGDDTVAYSGGVHINPPGNFFFGGGYHSIRGINGKIGFKF